VRAGIAARIVARLQAAQSNGQQAPQPQAQRGQLGEHPPTEPKQHGGGAASAGTKRRRQANQGGGDNDSEEEAAARAQRFARVQTQRGQALDESEQLALQLQEEEYAQEPPNLEGGLGEDAQHEGQNGRSHLDWDRSRPIIRNGRQSQKLEAALERREMRRLPVDPSSSARNQFDPPKYNAACKGRAERYIDFRVGNKKFRQQIWEKCQRVKHLARQSTTGFPDRAALRTECPDDFKEDGTFRPSSNFMLYIGDLRLLSVAMWTYLATPGGVPSRLPIWAAVQELFRQFLDRFTAGQHHHAEELASLAVVAHESGRTHAGIG
jgi:hypothetical protein